jgi:hypothetical protein
MSHRSTRCKYAVLHQLCQLIPAFLVAELAARHGVDRKARSFSPWSHVVALLYAQLAHYAPRLFAIRGATAPSKNALSHANRQRDAAMAESLFWRTLSHLMTLNKGFAGRRSMAMPRRFRRVVRAVDATTISLVANCMDWARHRRRKAAAKLHLSLNLQCLLPGFVVIDSASRHDKTHAAALCANMEEGEIAVFDKAYIDVDFLWDLTGRGVFWVTRAKENLKVRCVKRLIVRREGNILSDRIVRLTGAASGTKYPGEFRVVRALVEVDGELREMTFMTNNLEWAPASICDLYKSRWAIETFFKEIKQTLQLCDFLGHNQNAITWQIWTALLLYILMRFIAFIHGWERGFKRLFCLLRACVWTPKKIRSILESCGTAGGPPPMAAAPQQAYLPGFKPPRPPRRGTA